MPNRQIVNGEPYRYAFQGQEKDPETGKEAFQLRLWDGRIGRWLTTDPAGQYASPYLGMGNNPMNGVDPDGAKFFDWVRKFGSKTFYFDNDINSKADAAAAGVSYGGKTKQEALDSYYQYAGGWERMFGADIKFDDDSYFNAVILPFANNAISATMKSYKAYNELSFSEQQKKVDNNELYRHFDNISLNGKNIEPGDWMGKEIEFGGIKLVANFTVIETSNKVNFINHARFKFNGQDWANGGIAVGSGAGKTSLGINFSNGVRKETGVFWIWFNTPNDWHSAANAIQK